MVLPEQTILTLPFCAWHCRAAASPAVISMIAPTFYIINRFLNYHLSWHWRCAYRRWVLSANLMRFHPLSSEQIRNARMPSKLV